MSVEVFDGLTDRTCGSSQIAEIVETVRRRRRAHAEERDLGFRYRLHGVRGGVKEARTQVAGEGLGHTRLVEWCPPLGNGVDPLGDDVHAGNAMSVMAEGKGGDQTNVPCSHYR